MTDRKRGRPSAASLAVISSDGITTIRRPDPPEELTGEMAEEWRAVVNRLPADWFPRETRGVLVQLCRHRIAAHRIAQLIKQAEDSDDFDLPEYLQLLAAQDRESRCVTALSRALRLTPQSRADAALAGRKSRVAPEGLRPWEV